MRWTLLQMDQDQRQKSGQEELEDAVQKQIRAEEQDIRELRGEISAKEQGIRELRGDFKELEGDFKELEGEIKELEGEIKELEGEIKELEGEIKELEGEIKELEGEIRGVEKEISIATEIEVRKMAVAKLQFLREQITNLRHQISSRYQQISSRRSVSSGLSPGISEKLLQDLTEVMAYIKAEQESKKSVRISSASRSIWDALERQEGWKIVYQDIDPEPRRLSDLAAFGWDDRQERSQADRYIPHMSKIAAGRKWTLIDAANNHPTLLSGSVGGWNFKGTTDVAFVSRRVYECEPRRALRGIFQLKKNLQGGRDKAVVQTLICLVMANLLAQQFKPFAVLTDLDDHWSLYWIDGSTIHCNSFESRARAVGYIEELLQDSDSDEMGTSEARASMLSIKNRRMYDPPGMDNLKDLVGLIPDEEILDARGQLAVQQLQNLLHEFSAVPDVDVP